MISLSARRARSRWVTRRRSVGCSRARLVIPSSPGGVGATCGLGTAPIAVSTGSPRWTIAWRSLASWSLCYRSVKVHRTNQRQYSRSATRNCPVMPLAMAPCVFVSARSRRVLSATRFEATCPLSTGRLARLRPPCQNLNRRPCHHRGIHTGGPTILTQRWLRAVITVQRR